MFELKFNLKLIKLIFLYILMFYYKEIDGKKFSTHLIRSLVKEILARKYM